MSIWYSHQIPKTNVHNVYNTSVENHYSSSPQLNTKHGKEIYMCTTKCQNIFYHKQQEIPTFCMMYTLFEFQISKANKVNSSSYLSMLRTTDIGWPRYKVWKWTVKWKLPSVKATHFKHLSMHCLGCKQMTWMTQESSKFSPLFTPLLQPTSGVLAGSLGKGTNQIFSRLDLELCLNNGFH